MLVILKASGDFAQSHLIVKTVALEEDSGEKFGTFLDKCIVIGGADHSRGAALEVSGILKLGLVLWRI